MLKVRVRLKVMVRVRVSMLTGQHAEGFHEGAALERLAEVR